MNKVLAIGSLMIVMILSLQSQAIAQETPESAEGQFKLGAGLAFGSGVGYGGDFDNDLGLRVDGYYSVTPEIRAGGDFTFYFPKSEDGESFSTTATVWELNINGNYIFLEDEQLLLYALAGINITGLSFKVESGGSSETNSETEAGLNLGGGIEYGLDFGDLFGELKLGNLGGDADQFVIGVGVRFGI